jgi:ATP-dependent RNA helicase SUPV3L1/SUV3
LPHPEHWQGLTRQVEDKLSDALHERLAARFVDRRTSVLMRRLRENTMLEAQVTATGDVMVEGQHVGSLSGFHFIPDANASGPEAKALNAAAQKALVSELEARAARLSLAGDDSIVLANDGLIRWNGEPVGRLMAGEKILSPRIRMMADDTLTPAAREQVEQRLELWLKAHLTRHLGTLMVLEDAPDLTGIARGIAFQLSEALGVLDRSKVANDVKALEQDARAALRKHGIRFGAYHLYMPLLLKPAPRSLASQLWALKHGGLDQKGRDDIAHLALSGRTSIPADKEVARDLYRSAGFHVAGERALRVDILERLADLIRPAIAYRPGVTPGEPPAGAADGDGFVITGAMTSLVGASGADFANVLKALGYAVTTRPGPAITVPLLAAAPTEPAKAAPAATDAMQAVAGDDTAPAMGEAGPSEAAEAAVAEQTLAQDAPEQAMSVQDMAAEAAPHDEMASADDAPVTAAPADGEPAGSAPPVVEADIEVWRPIRKHQGQQGARRDNPRGERRGRGKGAPRAASETPPNRGPRPGRIVYKAPDVVEGAATVPAATADAERASRFRPDRKPQDGAAPRGERPMRERDGKPRDAGRPGGPDRGRDGQGRPRADDGERKPFGNREGRGPRPEQRFDSRLLRDDSQKPRADRQPDPDSPFAKLAALKAKLEGQPKG